MSEEAKSKKDMPAPVEKVVWGEDADDHRGYASDEERRSKRGLENWEMVERMNEDSDHKIPYWFIAIFVVLLLVAVGLTFPFWGDRAGYEREWFDWGIVGGALWVTVMSGIIYYVVDLRHRKKPKDGQETEENTQ